LKISQNSCHKIALTTKHGDPSNNTRPHRCARRGNEKTAVAAVPAAAPVVPAAAASPYAVMSGAANPNVFDFNKSDALNLFNKAITALDNKFDLAEENLRIFLEHVREWARIFSW
jgi:hypothetical protein